MDINILILGISAYRALFYTFVLFSIIMTFFIFAKVCKKQWQAFWGIIGKGVGVVSWNIRYYYNVLIVDKLVTGSGRKYQNQIKKHSDKIALLKEGGNQEEVAKHQVLLEKAQKDLAEHNAKINMSMSEMPKEARKAKKFAFRAKSIRSRIAKIEKLHLRRIAKIEARIAALEGLNKKSSRQQATIAYLTNMISYHKEMTARRIEIFTITAELYEKYLTLNKKQIQSTKIDIKVKKQHYKKDSFEVKRVYLKKYRHQVHHHLYAFSSNIKKWDFDFSEDVKNKYAAINSKVDGFFLEAGSKNFTVNILIKVGIFLLKIPYTILNFLLKLVRDLCLGILSFGVTLVGIFARLPINAYYYVIDFGPVMKYEIIKFFTIELKDNVKGYIYLAPLMVLLIVFTFYPIINTFVVSFQENYILSTAEFDGFGISAYKSILDDKLFLTAMKNTFFIVFVGVPISLVAALLISVGLNSIKRLQGLYQTVFFLPYITNTFAVGLVFAVLFADGKNGFVNRMLSIVGIKPITFFGSTQTGDVVKWSSAMILIISYMVWNALAFKIMVFLSGMQNINKQYYQAAKIDGTKKARTFFKITVPMISPMIAYVAITSFISSFKSYTSIVALYGEKMGAPGRSLSSDFITIVGYIMRPFSQPDSAGNLTQASAGAVILLAIIMLFTGIQMYVSNKKVHY